VSFGAQADPGSSATRAAHPEGPNRALRRRNAEGLVYLHVPNGGGRSKTERGPDGRRALSAPVPFRPLVRGRAGVRDWSDQRIATHHVGRLSKAGVITAVAHGLDRALAILEAWNLLKRTAHFGGEQLSCYFANAAPGERHHRHIGIERNRCR